MYENLRKEFYRSCMEQLSKEESSIATSILDMCMMRYDIVAKETALTVYDGNNLPQLVQYFLDCCRLKRLSEGTITGYEQRLRVFFETMNVMPSNVQRLHIRQFLSLLEQKGLKGTTVNRYYSTLSAFFVWMQNEQIISANPMYNIEKPKEKKAAKQPLTEVEVEKLKSACGSKFERAILETMLSTGVRVSELCHIKMADILWDEKQGDMTPIFIKDGKGGKDRTVYMKDSAMLYLKEYIDSKTTESEYLFSHNGIGYGREEIWRVTKKLKLKSGINKNFSPHICRHTCATSLCRRGADLQSVQQLLGHSSCNTTLIYAHADKSKVMSDLSRCGA